MRVTLAGTMAVLAVLGTFGCERELPYEPPHEQPIVGYRLEGYVTDRLGVPLRGVRVGLWYDYEFLDNVVPPVTRFVVDDTTKLVNVQVLDRNRRVRAVLYEGRAPLGELDVKWDQRDNLKVTAPSGVYTVEFSVNGVVKASYSVVVDGAVTATTDSLGHYVIPDENLPVGYLPVPRYGSQSRFVGNYRITATVALELYLDIRRGTTLSVTKNQITRRDFVI